MLKELKKCVSDDSDLDTVTRCYIWGNIQAADSIAADWDSRNSGNTGMRGECTDF